MPRNLKTIGMLILAVIFAAGCGTTVRTYTMKEERPDQELAGNAGYLTGSPPQRRQSSEKKTWTKLVVEVEKVPPQEAPAEDLKEVMQETEESIRETHRGLRRLERKATAQPRPRIRPVSSEAKEIEPQYTMYTIQKNDTLQKVSKRFYDTYRRWQQIYELNKDVIKDPNRIKPGTVIRIPKE